MEGRRRTKGRGRAAKTDVGSRGLERQVTGMRLPAGHGRWGRPPSCRAADRSLLLPAPLCCLVCSYDLPIFGLDVVMAGGRVTLAVVDCCPLRRDLRLPAHYLEVWSGAVRGRAACNLWACGPKSKGNRQG